MGPKCKDTWRQSGHVRAQPVTWRTYGVQGLGADTRRTHGGHEAGTWRTSAGHMADKRLARLEVEPQWTQETQGGHMADARRAHGRHRTRFEDTAKANCGRTHGGHMADKVWGGGCAHNMGGHKADNERRSQSHSRWAGGHRARTKCGDAAKTESKRTMADTWRIHGGQAPGTRPEHIDLTVKCLEKKSNFTCILRIQHVRCWQRGAFLFHAVRPSIHR